MSDPKREFLSPLDAELPFDTEDERALSPNPTEKKTRSKTQKGAASPAPSLDLSILLKFIKTYDGSRETLNSFIINCDNAYELANSSQKQILFKYILCQLQGKAELACSIKDFTTWEQLKDFLKTQFSERKHHSHLLAELQESKQLPSENVSQYSLKIETYLSQLLTEVALSNTKLKELPGRTAAMEELALHHFLMGLHPRISNIVRCKSPKTLNEAINFAISEERIQQTIYKRNILAEPKPRRAPQSYANSTNSNQSRSLVPYRSNAGPNRPTQGNFNTNTIICRYCKFPGHAIENCRKREYNNRLRNQNQSNTNQGPIRRVNFAQDHETEDLDEPNHDYTVSTNLN